MSIQYSISQEYLAFETTIKLNNYSAGRYDFALLIFRKFLENAFFLQEFSSSAL